MINRFTVCIRDLHSLVKLSTTSRMNIDKCYFRYIPIEDKIDITFLLKVKENIRQFNLSRKSSEEVQSLCSRIGANVQKVVNKKIKKKDAKEDTSIEVQIFNDNGDMVLDTYTCMELLKLQRPLKIKIYNQYYDVVFNSPWVINFNLPKSILVGFPVYPEHLETMYMENTLSTFNWYRGNMVNEKGNNIIDSHIKWDFIKNSFYYTPVSEDVGLKLKLECIPKNSVMSGPSVEVISKNVVEAGPGPCPFESRHLFTKNRLKDKSFRCVTYNILADLYCDSDYTRTVLHPYCPAYALEIDYRKQLILKELLGYNADIICLQEVDNKIFNHSLSCLLQVDGMQGLFYKKGKTVSEGLACFYRVNRFRCLGDDQILLSAAIQTEPYLQHIWEAVQQNDELKNRLLDRSTVASATFLQSCDNEKEIIIVGNTHLYFHPDADHIRLIQGGICIYWLRNIQLKLQTEYPDKRISIIMCGDFNSDPLSGIYKLYTTGIAPSTLPDWKSNSEQAVSGLTLEQPIMLGSACGTPQYTNFTAGFAECLDYIYYDANNLEVEQVVPFPTVEELNAHTALPNITGSMENESTIESNITDQGQQLACTMNSCNITSPEGQYLFDFTKDDNVYDWQEQSDTVRSVGMSKAVFVLHQNTQFRRAIFFALLNPQLNGAGFAGIRALGYHDLSKYTKLQIQCRGQGQFNGFKIVLRHKGLNDEPNYSFEQYFQAPKDEFAVKTLPFSEFKAYYRGKRVNNNETLDLSEITSIGIQMYGGVYQPVKQKGPATLEVDWIRAV